ncbi:fimbria/pilus periplasmic chaperone [Xanthomonas sp. 60]
MMSMRMMVVAALLAIAGAAHSKVVIHGTRVVYPAQEREVPVRLSNLAEDAPSVLQVWLDDGDVESTPDKVEVPFVVTPPVFRMDPGAGQTLRLSYTGEPLPQDRESLFWLNVLEVPPVQKGEGAEGEELVAQLQFAYRTRLKTFFRPKGLVPEASEAPAALRWSLLPAAAGRPARLQVYNPTPYYVSLSKVSLVDAQTRFERKRASQANEGMVAPRSSLEIELQGAVGPVSSTARVEMVTIGDYGNRVESSAALVPAGG